MHCIFFLSTEASLQAKYKWILLFECFAPYKNIIMEYTNYISVFFHIYTYTHNPPQQCNTNVNNNHHNVHTQTSY